MFQGCSKARFRRNIVAFFSVLALSTTGLAVSFFNQSVSASPANPVTAFDCQRYTTEQGNVVLQEEDCLGKKYVPDVANADAESQRIALGLFMGTMQACAQYLTMDDILAGGYNRTDPDGTEWQHWNSDKPQTITDVNAMIEQSANPPDVVLKSDVGQIAQTMFDGRGIAYLGSIPQIHNHGDSDHEMLHINCKPTIEDAFRYGYSEPQSVDASVYLDAYEAARTGGISAVSAQMGMTPGLGAAAPATASDATAPAAAAPTAPAATQPAVTAPAAQLPAPVTQSPVTAVAPAPAQPVPGGTGTGGTGSVTPAAWYSPQASTASSFGPNTVTSSAQTAPWARAGG
jgi:hypothetical protein